jgi:hypothetical protein
MDEAAAWPVRRDPHQRPTGHLTPAATVGLMTAARALGISPDVASELTARGELGCNVIKVGEGYRVPFAALLRVLDSGPGRNAGQDAAP